MSKLREVTSPAEFLQLLESSRLLAPEALSRAREAAVDSVDCRSLARQLVRQGWLTKWQAGQLLVGASRFHLGKYVLRDQIGRGDFGRVYLALHPQLERNVAIKTLSRRFTQRPDIVERFLTDAGKAAALDHPHVLHVYDIDSDEGQFYLVMEPIAGEDLRHRVDSQGPLSSEAVIRLLAEAAVGLAHAHERGVLHQTLQPANCMLDTQGSLKLVGFGMGRLVQADRPMRAADIAPTQVLWRAAFTAPEQQSEDRPGDVGGDLYALGCVAFFALTGKIPRGPASDGEFTDVARQLLELRTDIAPGLAELVGKLMAPRPGDRPASALELGLAVHDLGESLAKDRPLVKTESGTGALHAFDWVPEEKEAGHATRRENRLRRSSPSLAAVPMPRPRSPWLGFYIALVLMGLVVGAALVFWLTNRPTRETAIVPERPRRTQDSGHAASDAELATKSAPSQAESMSLDGPPGSNETPPNPTPPHPETPAPSTEMPPAETSPAETPPAETPPAESPKPEVPPPSETPQPSPVPPDSPPVNPFDGWLETLDVLRSTREAAEPLGGSWDIGKWRGSPAIPLEVALLGGSQAGPSTARFELAAISGGETPEWELAAVEDQAGGPVRHLVARLSPNADRLQFAWDAGTPEYAEAGHLANCVLRFSSGTFRHDLRLRKPVESEAFLLSLKKQPDAERVRLAAAPPAAHMRFQVTAIDEPLPRTFALIPADPVALDGTLVRVGFGVDAANPILLLDLKPELKNVFQLQGQVFFRLTGASEPMLWAGKRFQTVANTVAANQDVANLQAQGLRNRLIALGVTDPARAALEGELKLAESRLAECSQATQAVEWLIATRDAMAKGGVIHFRLFLLVDDCEVDLVRSR